MHKPFIILTILLAHLFTASPLFADDSPPLMAVFPPHNAGDEADWLSIGLQDRLTVDMRYLGALHTHYLPLFIGEIAARCPDMTLGCVAKLPFEAWREIAEKQGYQAFIWGEYRVAGEALAVTLTRHAAPDFEAVERVAFRAPVAALPVETHLSRLLAPYPIAPAEKARLLASRTDSPAAWEHNARGFWALQQYALSGGGQAHALAKTWRAHLERAVALDADYAEAWNNLGWYFLTFADFDAAETTFRKALALKPDLVDANMGLGYSLKGQQQPAEAVPFLARGVALNPALTGHRAYLNTRLGDLARFYGKQGNPAAMAAVHQGVLAIYQDILGPEHPDTALALNNLAELYRTLGDYARAEPLYRRALAIHEKVSGPEHPDTALALNNLAELYRTLGDYARAEPLYRRALAIYEKVSGPEHPDTATSLNNLAALYYHRNDPARAEPLFQRALAIYRKVLGPEHPDTALGLNNLARIYLARGKYTQAESLYRRTLDIAENVLGAEHSRTALALNSLGLLYYRLGDVSRAEPLLQRALAIREKALGPAHPDTAQSLNNLGMLYHNLGDPARAEPLYQRALAIYQKSLGPAHRDTATSLNNLAMLYYKRGELARAEPLLQRASAIWEKALGPEHPDTASSLNNLASLHARLGAHARAELLYRRALSVAVNSERPELLWRVQTGLSQLLSAQDHPQAAVFFGKQAVNTLQSLRAGIKDLDKSLQQSFLQDKTEVYQHLADALIGLGRLAEAQQVLAMLKEAEYFDFVRRDAESDARATQADYSAAEQPWAERYAAISGELVTLGRELRELKEKTRAGLTDAEQARKKQLRQAMRTANKAFQAYLEDLKTEFANPERAMEIGAKNLGRLKPLQSVLRELDAVLVHYLITEDKLRILLTTPDAQLARDSDLGAKALNRLVFDFRDQLQTRTRYTFGKSAKALYRQLIGPIAEDLKQAETRTLLLSLDGVLRYLPMAALYDGEQYLVEQYATVLYTEAAKPNLKDRPVAQWTLAGLGLSDKIEGFSALPSVESELEGIIRHGDADKDGVLDGIIRLNQAFNADAFLDTLDEGRPVLHIASHFVFKPGTDRASYLLLGDGAKLSLAQIREEYDFTGLDLLTLSACNTAMGANADGREVEGFGALAQRQGAKGVLATLWSVDDDSTGLFMRRLYERRATRSLGKAEALRQAQLEFIRAGETQAARYPKHYRHPYYWAPFILMGNWL